MFSLSIETSCDETAFAVGEITGSDFRLLSSVVLSQIDLHAQYGGVVPNLSAREHLRNFRPLLEEAIQKAGRDLKKPDFSLKNIDVFSVVDGPGLIPALLVGVSVAKTLAYFYQKPLVGIHHLEGHIYASLLDKAKELPLPALALVVSGGHTQLVLMPEHLKYEVIGETLDDAAGEAFDKAAKMMGLSYPGGPQIAELAKKGNPRAFDLPRPLLGAKNFDFSFSGLKTALLYQIKELDKQGGELPLADLAASFEEAVVETLIKKTARAVEKYQPKSLILAGGVAANQRLRQRFKKLGGGAAIFIPPLDFCLDNAAMQLPVLAQKIRKFGLNKYKNTWKTLEARASLEI